MGTTCPDRHHRPVTEPHLSRPESRPPSRLPVKAPAIPAPPLYAERRIRHRRVEDRTVHEERAFLARALDVLAADRPAEERLASLLRLLARTVGARRAAVLGQGVDRLVCVSLIEGEDPAAAQALAA